MDLGLTGKIALVTGSSRGIGRGIATRLTEEGADVVFCARGEEALAEAVAATAGPGRAHGVIADVTTSHGAASVVEAAVATFGGVDVVVANVGGSGARSIDEMDGGDLGAVLDKNLFSALHVSRAAVPALRERGGADGRWILTRSEAAARVWDSENGQPVSQVMRHTANVAAVDFQP